MTGVCGKTASTSDAMDRLIQRLKVIALNRKPTHELAIFIAKSLFMTITNTNFSERSIVNQLRKSEKLTGITSFDAPLGVHSNGNEDIVSLREFATYALKGIAAYMVHADELDFKDESLDDFIFSALRKIAESTSISELSELISEEGAAAVKAMALLDMANTETFGTPEKTIVKTYPGTRSGILVSGHDLKDLYELLLQTEGKNIDIYTHGEMLPAHSYLLFKKFPHLYGHYGTSWHHQNVEFATFNGPILLTSNCITPVQESYSGRIFTTGCCRYPNVPYIENRSDGNMKDFSSVIELAATLPPPMIIDNNDLLIGFGHAQLTEYLNDIIENIRNGSIKRLIVMAGCDGRQKKRSYYTDLANLLPLDTIILTAGCAKYRFNRLSLGEINGIPRIIDAGQCNDSYSLAVFALKLKEALGEEDINKLPISFDIAWYEQKAVAVLLALLSLGFKNIRLGPTFPAFMSEHVSEIIRKKYKLKQITSPHEDIISMLKGK